MVKKFTAEMTQILLEEYQAHVDEYKGPADEINKKFFQFMRINFDDFAEATDNQMRGVLCNLEVYKPTNPRRKPKKGGMRKADFIARVNKLVGTELPSLNGMTIADLEVLIERLEYLLGHS